MSLGALNVINWLGLLGRGILVEIACLGSLAGTSSWTSLGSDHLDGTVWFCEYPPFADAPCAHLWVNLKALLCCLGKLDPRKLDCPDWLTDMCAFNMWKTHCIRILLQDKWRQLQVAVPLCAFTTKVNAVFLHGPYQLPPVP